MRNVIIDNPIINSPFDEPRRHFRFDEEGITDEIVESRRISQYFIPIARPRKKSKDTQRVFDEWTEDRIEENKTVNEIRRLVKMWREGRYIDDVTRQTARLLEYWQRDGRDRPLFFCQIEALETLIYITEVAKRYGHTWIENDLRKANEDANPGLLRIACKMATGSGKTVVMAMLIAWQALNKFANPQDARFTDTFLIVTPGITIRDRLRVLLPSDPGNYYRALDIVPADLMDKLGQGKILVTNFHGFLRREKVKAAGLTKEILGRGDGSAFTESEGEMVRRVCRGLGTKKNVVVINDEAHHCYHQWENNAEARANGLTPPVFIVVCNNTNVSKMVFDYIAGWEKPLPDESTVPVPGKLPIFSNVEGGQFTDRPNTILVDSEQLESGEAMSDEFKKIATREIDEFKAEYRRRFPGSDPEKLTDEDLLREVLNTVGKPGKLGENVKCVVSVSMLTEGWDANTVTHILGVRAFGTQLLCEQVVGRGLRRMSYHAAPHTASLTNGETAKFEAFPVEYAEVYGVPFSFIPTSGSGPEPKPGPIPTRVRALADRIGCEITFPRIDGYRYELPAERLRAEFTGKSEMVLTTADVPTKVECDPIVGERTVHRLDDLKAKRQQEVAFVIARRVLEQYFRDEAGNPRVWVFPDLLAITRRWMGQCVRLKDNTFPQLLLLVEKTYDAADRIYKAIVASTPGDKRLLPIPKPYDTIGTTRHVDFDTIRPTYRTAPHKCHVSHVVADTDSWEQKMAQALEDMDEVLCYAKNDHLGFFIPYTTSGDQRNYTPDFIVRIDDGHGPTDPLNLILEVTGAKDKDKEAKVSTADTLWVPAVNNAGTWGRWAFKEITDPWDAKTTISGFLKGEE